MKHLLSILLFFSLDNSYSQQVRDFSSLVNTTDIKAYLNIPFGTITKLQVEIHDGNNLQMIAYQDTYLLKVNSVNEKPVNDIVLFRFTDETKQLANDNFTLYKLTYRKTAKSLTNIQIDKMKKGYVGKKFTIVAYETGRFTGIPTDYFKYRPVREDVSFHFEHYLIVVSILPK